MSEEKKHREFYIELKNMCAFDEKTPAHRPSVRVIEYAAIEELNIEFQRAKKMFQDKIDINLDEITQLKQREFNLESKNEELKFQNEKLNDIGYELEQNLIAVQDQNYYLKFSKKLLSEITQLKQDLKITVEALKQCSQTTEFVSQNSLGKIVKVTENKIVIEALAKIQTKV